MFYLGLVPLIAGALAFSGEQFQKRYQIAANRGVSAGFVWLSKHVVWFPVAMIVCALLVIWQAKWGFLLEPIFSHRGINWEGLFSFSLDTGKYGLWDVTADLLGDRMNIDAH
jgi:hypothetical protein